jgi:hypothetical protein
VGQRNTSVGGLNPTAGHLAELMVSFSPYFLCPLHRVGSVTFRARARTRARLGAVTYIY